MLRHLQKLPAAFPLFD